MPLSKEQLLIPRYLCTGTPGKLLWPGCQWEDGLIISEDQIFSIGKYAADFPHLFEPLPWWHGRMVEEMPEFVKDKFGKVKRVLKYSPEYMTVLFSDDTLYESLAHYQPATEQEYLSFKGLRKCPDCDSIWGGNERCPECNPLG